MADGGFLVAEQDAAPEWALKLAYERLHNVAHTMIFEPCSECERMAREVAAAFEAQMGRLREEMTLWRTEGETAKERDFQKRRAEAAESRLRRAETALDRLRQAEERAATLERQLADWRAATHRADSRLK